MYKLTIIPFNYFIKTRLKSKVQKISWGFVYFIPGIMLYLFATDYDFSIRNILMMMVGILLVNYIYENGYIENDIVLTQKEKNPNLRIVGKQLANIRDNIKSIFFIRYVVIVFLIVFMGLLVSNIDDFILFIVVLLSLQLTFKIYNNIRNIFNLYLVLPLSYFRFYGFILPFVNDEYFLQFVLFTSLLYPLSKVLEFTRQPRYKLPRISLLIGNTDKFRVYYYLIVVFIFSLSFCLYEIPILYLYISLYYLLFRLGTLLMIRKNKMIRDEILKNTKSAYRE